MSEHEMSSKLPPQLPPQNTALTVPDLHRQLIRLTATQRAEMGMDLSSHESAQEKLNRISMLTENLAHTAGRITVELSHRNPEAFAEALREVHNIMSSIEIELVTFDAAVETQYPKVSFMQKLVVAVVMVVRGMKESTFIDTLGNTDRTRTTLFDARKALTALVERHQKIVKETQNAIVREKEGPARQRQRELLEQNERYQKLLAEKRSADGDLIVVQNNPAPSWGGSIQFDETGLKNLRIRYGLSTAGIDFISRTDYEQYKQQITNAILGKLSRLNAEIATIEETTLGTAKKGQSSGM